MTTKLPHSIADPHKLRPDDLVLAYRDVGDYASNSPELDGVIRLVHESKQGVWDVKHRLKPQGVIVDGSINLNDFDTVCYVSRSADNFIGQK